MIEAMEWYRQTIGPATTNAVAEKSGIVQSTLARQLKADALTPETVVAVARAYEVDVIDGLIALGLIREEDVRRHSVASTLRSALDIEIAAEVTRRLSGGGSILDAPLT